jgi:hypothetical protein
MDSDKFIRLIPNYYDICIHCIKDGDCSELYILEYKQLLFGLVETTFLTPANLKGNLT